MTPSEYRYHIEKVYSEVMCVSDWLISDEAFSLFEGMATNCDSPVLVLDNWKIFLGGYSDKSPEDYFEWWNKYKPYELEGAEKAVQWNPEKKKSPFDAVKKKVDIF